MDHGRFVWRDLMSTDPEAAKAFYRSVFNWEIKGSEDPAFGDYEMIHVDNGAIGGVMPLDPSHGIPSHWMSYVTVPDSVDAACERAKAAGGTIGVEPMDIPTIGRFAVIVGPEGSACSPFAPESGVITDEDGQMPPPGHVSWNELSVADPTAALAFYSSVFGWEGQVQDMGMSYTVLMADGKMRGGLMQQPAPMPGMWVIYFAVADIAESGKAIAAAGGQVMGPVIDVPETGRVQWATDPTGAVFAIHQPPV